MMSAIWDWALEVYARPGVEAALLDLQDRHGQCVPYLLWALWAAPELETLALGADLARGWSGAVIEPLRSARRAAKAERPGLDDSGRLALREALKASELSAERLLFDGLARLATTGAGPQPSPLDRLAEAGAAWGEQWAERADRGACGRA